MDGLELGVDFLLFIGFLVVVVVLGLLAFYLNREGIKKELADIKKEKEEVARQSNISPAPTVHDSTPTHTQAQQSEPTKKLSTMKIVGIVLFGLQIFSTMGQLMEAGLGFGEAITRGIGASVLVIAGVVLFIVDDLRGKN